jgi:hypothetical protein
MRHSTYIHVLFHGHCYENLITIRIGVRTSCIHWAQLSRFHLKEETKSLPPETGTSSIDWAQLSRFHLKEETESILRNVVF